MNCSIYLHTLFIVKKVRDDDGDDDKLNIKINLRIERHRQ